MRTGGCLCGAVRYRVDGPMRPTIACHCGQCRKASGNYVAATSAARDAVAVEGEVTWFASSPEARRGFCGFCGSNLFWDGPGANLSIHAGILDPDGDAPAAPPLAGHIFTGTPGRWYAIEGDLPRAEGADPVLTTMAKT